MASNINYNEGDPFEQAKAYGLGNMSPEELKQLKATIAARSSGGVFMGDAQDTRAQAQDQMAQLDSLIPKDKAPEAAPEDPAAKALREEQAKATGITTGTDYATDKVMNSPMFGRLLGAKDSSASDARFQEQNLLNNGFGLTTQDHDAYGQASGNIARMFGQQEQGAAQSLADRGLAAAPSGAAGAMFSGLQGNKNEMLANAQSQIAGQRIQNAQNMLNANRQYQSQLGQLGNSAVQNQFGNAMASKGQDWNQYAQQQQLNQGNRGLDIQQQNADLSKQAWQKQQEGPGIGGILGGLAGAGIGAMTGGIGTGVGASLGAKVGNMFGNDNNITPQNILASGKKQ
jgi:hypothetical protein